MQDQLLTVRQAASMLSLGKHAIYRWIHEGKIQSYEDPSGKIRIRLAEILRPKIGKQTSASERGKRGQAAMRSTIAKRPIE